MCYRYSSNKLQHAAQLHALCTCFSFGGTSLCSVAFTIATSMTCAQQSALLSMPVCWPHQEHHTEQAQQLHAQRLSTGCVGGHTVLSRPAILALSTAARSPAILKMFLAEYFMLACDAASTVQADERRHGGVMSATAVFMLQYVDACHREDARVQRGCRSSNMSPARCMQ